MSSEKPQLLVTVGVRGPVALSAAEASSASSCPAVSSVLLFAEGGNIPPPDTSVSPLTWWAALAGAASTSFGCAGVQMKP